MAAQRITVAFICTGNACRSQMAEALLRHVAADKFEVLSAGTRPAGFVHPLALQALDRMGVPTAGLESKDVIDILDRPVHIAITVCDNASAECPRFPSGAVAAHWPLPDPAYHPGSEEERSAFCSEIAERVRRKVERLAALPVAQLSPTQLAAKLERLAQI